MHLSLNKPFRDQQNKLDENFKNIKDRLKKEFEIKKAALAQYIAEVVKKLKLNEERAAALKALEPIPRFKLRESALEKCEHDLTAQQINKSLGKDGIKKLALSILQKRVSGLFRALEADVAEKIGLGEVISSRDRKLMKDKKEILEALKNILEK